MGSLRAVRLVKFETSGIYFTYKFMLLFVYTTTQKMFCNFHIQVFQIKLKYHRCKLIKLQQLLNSLVKGLRNKMTPALITFSSVRKGHAFLSLLACYIEHNLNYKHSYLQTEHQQNSYYCKFKKFTLIILHTCDFVSCIQPLIPKGYSRRLQQSRLSLKPLQRLKGLEQYIVSITNHQQN